MRFRPSNLTLVLASLIAVGAACALRLPDGESRAIVFYSMTFWLVGLYPLALLTQHLLRSRMKDGTAEPNPGGEGELDSSDKAN